MLHFLRVFPSGGRRTRAVHQREYSVNVEATLFFYAAEEMEIGRGASTRPRQVAIGRNKGDLSDVPRTFLLIEMRWRGARGQKQSQKKMRVPIHQKKGEKEQGIGSNTLPARANPLVSSFSSLEAIPS